MSTVQTATKPVGIKKRLAASERLEIVNAAANVTVGKAHINAVLNTTAAINVTFPQDSDDTGILVGHWGWVRTGAVAAVALVAGSGATLNEQIADLGAGVGRWAMWVKVAPNTYDVTGNYAS
jgi:hypothetical protein